MQDLKCGQQVPALSELGEQSCGFILGPTVPTEKCIPPQGLCMCRSCSLKPPFPMLSTVGLPDLSSLGSNIASLVMPLLAPHVE